MTALRSRRLEQIFGASLAGVTYEHVTSLVANNVSESFDLEFKEPLYGLSERAKRDLASDVAAMANTSGGVIVLGVQEDDQARAAATPGVELGDAEYTRMRQIVASQVSPLPVFDILPVENPERSGHGFILLAVPRSVMSPHAVIVNDGMRFPQRHGTTTTYLSEPQVAQAYRARFLGLASRLDEAERTEREFLQKLNYIEQVFVVLTLVPDIDGACAINTATFDLFMQRTIGRDPHIVSRGTRWQRASVRRRRLVADGSKGGATGASYIACELHETGMGCFAAVVAFDKDRDVGDEVGIEDEVVVHAIASGLRFLATHARDRAAAGGLATVRATIYPIGGARRAYLFQNRTARKDHLGRQDVTERPMTDGVFDIDDLANDGQLLMVATHVLASGLFQEFGLPEALQIAADGAIRKNYWQLGWSERIVAWADVSGVSVTDEAMPFT